MKILLQRISTGLGATDDREWEKVKSIKPGEYVLCEIKRARNPRQHALFWALVDYIYRHQQSRTKHQVANLLKVGAGWCDEFTDKKTGRVITIPKSISEANMPADEFEEFLTRVLDFVAAQILPNVSVPDVRAELERMVTGLPAYIERAEIVP